MPRTATVLLPFFLLLLVPCALAQRGGPVVQTPQNQEQDKVDVRVRVTDRRDRTLDHNVIVDLCTRAGAIMSERLTDDRGEVTFPQLDPGNYAISIRDLHVEEQDPSNFTIFPREGVHFETVHVTPKPSDNSAESPGGTVSAAELNIPGNALKEFDKGNQLLRDNKPEEARKHYEKAVTIYPNYSAAYNNLGVIAIRAQQPQVAREYFTRALTVDPNNANASLNLARMVFPEHDWAKVDDLLHHALAGEPTNVEALTMLTVADYSLKKYSDAVADAHRVHGLEHGKYAVVHLIAARSCEALHDPQQAMVEYKMFLKEAPSSPSAAEAQSALTRLEGGN